MYYTTAMSKALFGKAVVTKDTNGIVKNTFDSDFSNYLADDWMRYWKSKAKDRNIKYVPVKYKDVAVLKKLVKDFKSSDIKVMIDYIWDDSTSFVIRGERLLPSSYGLFLLSGAFLNSVSILLNASKPILNLISSIRIWILFKLSLLKSFLAIS